MNRVQPENVHSTIFTPQEYQVELIDSCLQRNTVAVLASRSTRTFLVTMVTRELSNQTRSFEQGGSEKCTLITGKSGPKLVKAGEAIQQNTNLAVATYTSLEQVKGWSDKWAKIILESQVVVMTSDALEVGFNTGFLQFDRLNLFVVTDAQQIISSHVLQEILLKLSPECRILAMTSPVLRHSLSPVTLDSLLTYLKQTTACTIDTSSEIVTILRYVNKPHERVIMCASPFNAPRSDAEIEIRRITEDAMAFLEDHRYDLVEVYGPEYAEFCVGVPDPIKEPKQILKDFINVLDHLGMWCADRAALYSLVEIEKLKKKTAYDRHYLLLCLMFSVMARIRSVIESAFENFSELNQILNFSTPKVLRLIDILRQIRPINFVDPRKRREKTDPSGNAAVANRTNSSDNIDSENICSLCNCRKGVLLDAVNSFVECAGESNQNSGLKSLCFPVDDNDELRGCDVDNDIMLSCSSSPLKVPCDGRTEPSNCSSFKEKVCPESDMPDCDFLPSEEEGPAKDVSKTSCDSVTSTSHLNGNLSRSSSEGSFHESELNLPSVPTQALPVCTSHSCHSTLAAETHSAEVSSNSSSSPTSEMISCNSFIPDDKDLNEDEMSCPCNCHITTQNPDPELDISVDLLPPTGALNSVDSIDKDKEFDYISSCEINSDKSTNNENEIRIHFTTEKEVEGNVSEEGDNEQVKSASDKDSPDVYSESINESTNSEDKGNMSEKKAGDATNVQVKELENATECKETIEINQESINESTNKNNATIEKEMNGSEFIKKEVNEKECFEKKVIENECIEKEVNKKESIKKKVNELESVEKEVSGNESVEKRENKKEFIEKEVNKKECIEKEVNKKECIEKEVNKKECIENEMNGNESIEKEVNKKKDIEKEVNEKECIEEEANEKECIAEMVNEKECIKQKINEKECIEEAVKKKECIEKEMNEKECIEKKMNEKEYIEKEVKEKESIEKEVNENVSIGKEVNENESIDKEVKENKSTEKDVNEKECFEKEVNGNKCIEKEINKKECIEKVVNEKNVSENEDKQLKKSNEIKENSVTDSSAMESSAVVTSEAVAMADTLAQLLPVTKPRRKRDEVKEKVKVHNPEDPDSVCGLIFVHNRNTAKIIYRLLKELSDIGGEFSWIFPQYTVELCKNAIEDPRAAEAEHKKQEEVFRRFRHHECNLLVSTSVLEEGIDIPNCNLVVRLDPASCYSSYVYSRGRAKGLESFYFHLVVKEEEENFFNEMSSYATYEQVLLNECGSLDKGTDSEVTPDEANALFPQYVTTGGASVSMATAISLLNKYCAKLPSDTFTRLTAMWAMDSRVNSDGDEEHQCTIMLPINSPLKEYTKGFWMKKKSLAKMSTALACCQRLHEIGELNDSLLPVGKESMQLDIHLCAPLPDDQVSEGMPRPGSTKRRQYYYKQVSEAFIGDEPSPIHDLWVYKLEMVLSCPIPDEQNTRGRKIYRPELSSRSLAIVTTKPIPQVSGFPVFTRSGEVMVRMKETHNGIRISEENLERLKFFHMFTFTQVLRLEKYPIKFNPKNASSAFFIAPLLTENNTESIDWDFVKLIQLKGDLKPTPPSDEARKKFRFNQSLYQDAVVMPWYRNQDQPQYFYVAEICAHLHPQSDFPDAGFESFEKYYLTKYGLQICNLGQPLLDVDHTSGRLNLLTPRHVNRKGVALPTTSEETKKAKRENLQQKQILVPELCTIHPFPASLWRKAVCLPTILYRINGLLLANELRVQVAKEIGLGMMRLRIDFVWPNLDFGWTLADVLAKNKETSKKGKENAQNKMEEDEPNSTIISKPAVQKKEKSYNLGKGGSEMEIGTWSNEMALLSPQDTYRDNEDDFEIETFDPSYELPDNLTLLDGTGGGIGDDVEGELGADWGTGLTERKARAPARSRDRGDGVMRVGSPSNFETDGWDTYNGGIYNEGGVFGPYGTPSYDDYYDYGDDDFDGYESEAEELEEEAKEREKNEWEEQGKRRNPKDSQSEEEDEGDWPEESFLCSEEKEVEFAAMIQKSKEDLMKSKTYLGETEPIFIEKACRKKSQQNIQVTNEGSSQTDPQSSDITMLNACPQTTEECSTENVLTSEEKLSGRVERGTQTDVVSVIVDIVPEVSYKVERTKTLMEVKTASETLPPVTLDEENNFSFDCQPNLEEHPGPPPSIVLQALTMSNANDGVNLERLETIGDSYLKYAITNYLYCTYTQKHEGKLSYLRSKQVSNLNLYRLGKRKGLGERMVATKFEPHDNWLPPGYFVPRELEEALIDSGVPAGHWNMADFPGLHDLGSEEIRRLVHERSEQIKQNKAEQLASELISVTNPQDLPIFIPYNLLTQHSIPDKSISDCVEALIGAYLTTCGPRGALLFMSWLGIKVLPSSLEKTPDKETVITYHQLLPPRSPLDSCPLPNAKEQLELLLSGYSEFEKKIGYAFRDRSYLLQAFTHASYYRNRLTDCYQRLEFLGDAVLDYLITRHLFEDKRQHSPGSLTDLRSALVNNTIFACLAVKFEFHKYFRHFSPGLDRVVRDFVRMQEENGHKINEEYYFMEEEECEAAEDIEVPKALGDVFESVAGAIFLDSGGSLDAVWNVYFSMMKNEIEQFSGVVPKSPIRELLETEPETAKFGKPERLVDGKVRVSVEIFGKGSFSGVGRNYRIAKSTAAKRALRHLKKLQVLANLDNPSFH